MKTWSLQAYILAITILIYIWGCFPGLCTPSVNDICSGDRKVCHIYSDYQSKNEFNHFIYVKGENYSRETTDSLYRDIVRMVVQYSDTVQYNLPIRTVFFQRKLRGFSCNLDQEFFNWHKIADETVAGVRLNTSPFTLRIYNGDWLRPVEEHFFEAKKLADGTWQIIKI